MATDELFDLREEFSKKTADVNQAQFHRVELMESLRVNRKFFINFTIPGEITTEIPPLHLELFETLVNLQKDKNAIACPRGHGKSTVMKIVCTYLFLFTKLRHILYCSATAPMAKNYCRDIIGYLKSENFEAVFGKPVFERENESEGIWIFRIRFPSGDGKYIDKECVLKALGAGQQVRGTNIKNSRPELMVFDDAEDDEIIDTEEARRKFMRWAYKAAFKARARDGKIVYIGNISDNGCLLAQLIDDPDWGSIRYGCIKSDGTPLWPGLWTIEALKKDYAEYKRRGELAAWFAEMMNIPMPKGLQVISVEDVDYRPARTNADISMGFITIDPAISVKTSANKTAIVVHGLCESRWQICDFVCRRMDPLETFQEMVKLCQYWRIKLVGIESIAYQAALQVFFPLLLQQHGLHDIQVVPLQGGGRKQERIVAWVGWIKDKVYALNDNDIMIMTQLLAYDTTRRENDDDLIDACAYGPQMINDYLQLMQLSLDSLNKKIEHSFEVCGI